MTMTATGAGVTATAAATYFRLRRELVSPGCERLVVPADAGTPFWSWYAGWLRGGEVRVEAGPAAGLAFPEPTGEVAQWCSGGLASAYTDLLVNHLSPTRLSYRGFAAEVEPHRGGAPLLFTLAVLSAHRGAACSYVGVARRAALAAPAGPPGPTDLDADLEFLARWNEFHPALRLRTVCGDLTRERLLAALPPGAEHQLEGCGRTGAAPWCGDCALCFDTFYAAKAVGRPLGFRLSRRVFEERYTRDYRTWLDAEFRGAQDGGPQLLARLQITHGLTCDPGADVDHGQQKPTGTHHEEQHT
ncbi:hypothetical protein AB0B12_29740 [Streptomyces sp. NPDC044780]|uniref:hypothetical protein n=1 Tax=unclassified Streptomyces TaxID=2593676 RepID=UPI0033E42B62